MPLQPMQGPVWKIHPRTHTEEFYEIHDVPWTIPELNEQRKNWEYTDNGMRPHQALGYKTPIAILKGQWHHA